MSIRYRIKHTTTYRYLHTVTLSHNLAHLAIRPQAHITVEDHNLHIIPLPSTRHHRTDYFGNPTTAFVIAEPHQELVVTSTTDITIIPPFVPLAENTIPWDDNRVRFGGDNENAWEYRFDSAQVPCDHEFFSYASYDFTVGRPVLSAALALTNRIHNDFVYDATATNVTTPVLDALRLRRGVCQDFAHVLIGCLRTMGLCARYVSGYLETTPPPGTERLIGADASHAWVQLWCGPEHGWIDLDPTNNCIPYDRHICVAVGRDFSDVSPLKGMVLGGGNAEVLVGVDVERLPLTNGTY